MAYFQNQYGPVRYNEYGTAIDEYGNPIRLTDAHGNPIRETGTTTTTAYGGAPEIGTGHYKEHHRSGSLSSSGSSEADGHGGRRKKGLKEKIKEKLPGHHKEDRPQATSTTTPGGYYSVEGHHEKKGIMDKIKEKLPGDATTTTTITSITRCDTSLDLTL